MTDDKEDEKDPNCEDERRYCWICFATEEEDQAATWVQPCRCQGTTKWVHQHCLQRWIDEKQRGNTALKVNCRQCSTEYVILFPSFGIFVYMMDLADRLLYKVCPFVAAGVVVGSVYWTAVTYGAVTVMQVLGHKEGLHVMEEADPLFLLVGLPTIPVMLILGKMVRWEDYILRLWRRHFGRIPGLKNLLSSVAMMHSFREYLIYDNPSFSDPVSHTRALCGALILPTVATVLGKVLFSSVQSRLQRALLGGLTFVAIKGGMKIYLKHQQFLRQCQRRVLNFEEHNESL